MKEDLYREVIPLIERDFAFDPKKKSADWLQGGTCPHCGKKELYTSKQHPWVLKCGRMDKCGAEIHIREQYPDLFEKWGERYPTTTEAPNAAADAYLREARGFDLERIQGIYVQEYYHDHELKIGSTSVRFPLATGGYWERLIDEPGRFGKKKAHFKAGCKYQGTLWTPPMPMPDDELWIVEGIFDSLALMHHGIWAGSAMSCVNYPHIFLTALAEQCVQNDRKRPKLVWALDGDKAGKEHIKKWVERSRTEGWDSSAALIRQKGRAKRDWNDLHLADRLKKEDIEECRYWGSLLTARSAADKAGIMFVRKGWNQFYFDFDNRLYWFEIDFGKLNEAKKAIREMAGNAQKTDEQINDMAMERSRSIREIANCLPTALYYQANHITDEAWYYVRIEFPHDGPSIKSTFTGAQVRVAGEFSKRLIHIAPGALYRGNQFHLDMWLGKQMFGIKTVQTIDFIGYSKEHGAWIFDDIAVKAGAVHQLNEEDYFDIGKLAVKSLNQSVALHIEQDFKKYDPDWVGLLWYCFKAKGMVALAYWMGSLFAEQIRGLQETYPFIEIVGDPGAGKSTIIEFLWKLVGRTGYEGFDPQKATVAARARNFAQVANLPVVLIESDRDSGDGADKIKQKGFDWDELKTAYNGRSVRSTGVKNSGNDTREPPFRAAIVISQNAAVSASPAFMERLMHVHFALQPHSEASREAFQMLARYPVEKCSSFVLLATKAEAAILKTVAERTPVHEKALDANPNVKHFRIIKNHAQLMALVEALGHVIDISRENTAAVLAEIVRMAEDRQKVINADAPMVQEFWELFDYIEDTSDGNVLDHSRDPNQIAVNLNDFIQKAEARRQQIPDMKELKKLLRTSRHRKFVDVKTVNSALTSKSIKCWVFQREKSQSQPTNH